MPCCVNLIEFHVADANLQGLIPPDLLFPEQPSECPLLCLSTDSASQLTLSICPFDLQKPIKKRLVELLNGYTRIKAIATRK